MFTLTRIIHPVGQGAFYSERFIDAQGKVHNIVYDCGSLPAQKTGSALNREIDSAFQEEDHIDILFISHFDADHINGILRLNRHYKIDHIVLPQITNNMWYLYAMGINGDYLNVMIRFVNFLNRKRNSLIEVLPIDEENSGFRDELGSFISLNDLQNDGLKDRTSNPIKSGRPITTGKFSNFTYYWCYIPMNFAIDPNDLATLWANIKSIKMLDGKQLTEEDLKHADKIASVTKEIKQAFKNSKMSLNESSLVVYSGPSSSYSKISTSNRPNRVAISAKCFEDYDFHYWRHEYFRHVNNHLTACLFTGDAMLDAKRLSSIASYIHPVMDNIGAIQIPHHGSAKNFFSDIFVDKLKIDFRWTLCFASYGTKNSYGHPSMNVIIDLALSDAVLFGVTEKKDTELAERISIKDTNE